MKIQKLIITCLLLAFTLKGYSQYLTKTFKTVDTVTLDMNIYYPDQEFPSRPLPAIVFFFGGGWVSGNPGHFSGQAAYLASKGIIAITPNYRTRSKHSTTPLASLADAKSAMRYIKSNAEVLGISPDSIVAAGGSAGGHLALACATIPGFNDPHDDLSVSTMPAALVLFNPVVNTWQGGYGMERFGEHAKAASPLHQLKPGLPPAIIYHGTNDKIVRIDDVRNFTNAAKAQGDHCKLVEFDGRGHGFFNKRGTTVEDYRETLLLTEKFLIYNHFLPCE